MDYSTETCLDFIRSIPDAEHLANDLNEICIGGDVVRFLCFDIHSLRKVNRAYSRKVGDALLAAVAEWAFGFPSSKLYRIESDQFCVLFRNVDIGSVHRYAGNMEQRFGRSWKLTVENKEYTHRAAG